MISSPQKRFKMAQLASLFFEAAKSTSQKASWTGKTRRGFKPLRQIEIFLVLPGADFGRVRGLAARLGLATGNLVCLEGQMIINKALAEPRAKTGAVLERGAAPGEGRRQRRGRCFIR